MKFIFASIENNFKNLLAYKIKAMALYLKETLIINKEIDHAKN